MNRLVILMLFALSSGLAQDKADSLRIEGELGIRGKWQTGNFAQFVVNPNARLNLETKKAFIELRSNYELLKVNGGSLINDLWSYGLVQYQQEQTLFPMAIIHYGFSQAYAIDRSWVGGVGVGINLLPTSQSASLQSNFFLGGMDLKYEGARAHTAFSVGSYLKLEIPLKNEAVRCFIDSHTYLSLQNTSYHSLNARAILSFRLLQHLYANVTYRLVYNNNNPSVSTNTNGKLIFGFNYTFTNKNL